ncbi:MAG: hypothetical protein N2316_13430 [Spirochaetes bacterium]|nr:hypothetical protein [Spirochaetota bacterium]
MNRIANGELESAHSVSPILRISNGISELIDLKEEISSLFQEIASFLLETSREMDSFQKIITPYIEYFYAHGHKEGKHECFIDEVVKPSKEEMEQAISQAVSIMQNDSAINETVESSIKKALAIKPIVESLLGMIEAIETYSWNAMLISTKAGIEGRALATISAQVSTLSASANEIANKCTHILNNLNWYYHEFEEICQRIDIINENYLTRMSIKSGVIFKEMLDELEKMSVSVKDIMEYASSIHLVIGNLMEQIQREDIVRQDLEKAIGALEVLDSERQKEKPISILYEFLNADEVEKLIYALLKRKYNNVYFNLQSLVEGTEDCCVKIKRLIDSFLQRFYNKGEHQWGELYEGKKFDAICEKLENMKGEFVGYIEEIISNKRRLYELSNKIVDSISTFKALFDEMIKISRKFEIINMLTKIELAKHATLRKNIGGSLVHVSNLPSEMKRMVENAIDHHRIVMSAIEKALDEYSTNFLMEEKVLTRCNETMRKISVKLYESQKYYRDISEKIGSTGMSILAFLESRTEECAHGREMVDAVYRNLAMVGEVCWCELDELIEDEKLKDRLKLAYEAVEGANGSGSANATALKSILVEALSSVSNQRVMLF